MPSAAKKKRANHRGTETQRREEKGGRSVKKQSALLASLGFPLSLVFSSLCLCASVVRLLLFFGSLEGKPSSRQGGI
jgi:hypothetical protein